MFPFSSITDAPNEARQTPRGVCRAGEAATIEYAVEAPAVADAVRNHVLTQPLRLRSYPEDHTGALRAHSTDTDTFEAL